MPSAGRRSTTRRAEPPEQPRAHPEKKFTTHDGTGVDVAVWLNTVDTDDGPRRFRSISVSPRRYRDRQTGEWKDGSFRASDLASLIFALEQARLYVLTTPLPDASTEYDR